MGKISGFIRKAKELGISGAVKHGFKKVTGIRKNEEQIDTLYYFLNHIVDITSIKPAEGALRKLQLCDAALLNVFDAICEREGWTYWLSFGTLLGAVRHKGFIPWDDDTDVSMPREDYDDAVQRLPGIFASYGNDSISCNVSEPARIGMGYRHLKTGVWCDIFPVDEVYSTDSTETAKKELAGRMRKYSAFCNKKGRNLGSDELASERTKYTNILGGGGIT